MKQLSTVWALAGALSLSSLPSTVRAAVYTNPSDVPSSNSYDFIVVGAGTAGNVVASRLSEDSSKKVLVIEAGVDDTGVVTVEVPFLAPLAQNTAVDWNYTTIPQTGLNGRSITVPRGFVLGGSSSINFLGWTRGSEDLYNKIASITGDSGWGWDALESFWTKISTFVQPTDNDQVTPDEIPQSNGNGPLDVSLPNFDIEPDERVFETAKLLQSQDSRFKYTVDMNAGDSLGFGYNQVTAGGGARTTSATAYLHPALNSRSNIDLLINTRVTRLLQSSTSGSTPVFGKVEVAQKAGGPKTVFQASSEVILSAGTIGTAQILLLSGIGPEADLGQVVVNSPDVGKNVRDHPLLELYFSVNSNDTYDDALRDADLQTTLLNQWFASKTGLFADTPVNTLGFMRLPDSFFTSGVSDPSSGAKSAHTEVIFVDAFVPTAQNPMPSVGDFMTVIVAVVSPTSVGSIKLASGGSDTFTQPLIDYGLLSTDFDVQAMLQAITDSETFIAASPFHRDGFLVAPFGGFANATTTQQKVDYMRNNADTVHHPVGSAKMGADSPSSPLGGDGVTDPRLRVRGVKGLRVVDASVLPIIPECHTQAAVYLIAERAASLIKEDNGM
ncbi:hypothetical protein D9758_012818 [Tetrapyrgos nigripes]|uniref:Uncharacterized protein n=1 Tax=Tetrapyrgos nigripes TaxID=182062 RepID=A0A8H5CYJ9_9AGAR|nr:hypothetical protein D9758_012818 [Tetrapyrgos nigripes]